MGGTDFPGLDDWCYNNYDSSFSSFYNTRFGWSVKDKAGLQSGYYIMVQWLGTISSSAWHHEIGHMIRQEILHKSIDYKHEDTEWWKAIEELKNAFENDIGSLIELD